MDDARTDRRRLPAGDRRRRATRFPAGLLELGDYWSFWHGFKGYSGVALLVRKSVAPEPPDFAHPPLRPREPHRHGGRPRHHRLLHLCAERRQGFSRQDALPHRDAELRQRRASPRPAAGHVRRFQRRAPREGRASRRSAPSAPASCRRNARCWTTSCRTICGSGPRAGAGRRPALHLVGAVAPDAPAQHRLAAWTISTRAGSSRRPRRPASWNAKPAPATTAPSSPRSTTSARASNGMRSKPTLRPQAHRTLEQPGLGL